MLFRLLNYHEETYRHTVGVVKLSTRLARYVGLREELETVKFAAMTHDIGKIKVPLTVLNKPGPLDDWEMKLIREHTYYGSDIVSKVPGMEIIRPVILYHHERWDGTGYPVGLNGIQIPYTARIIALADAFDAITTDRVYRPKASMELAVRELGRCAGSQFDPSLVEAFTCLLNKSKKLETDCM